METFLQQFPIVFHSLNIGFLQTLRLFGVTLLGAVPLGLIIAFGSMSRFKPLSLITNLFVWVIRGTPLMIQLLIIYYFPGLVLGKTIWGGDEAGRFTTSAVAFIVNRVLAGQLKSVAAGSSASVFMTGAVKVTAQRDDFTGSHVSVVPKPKNEGSGGGGSTISASGFGGSSGGKF